MLLEEKSIFFYTWNARTNNFKVEKKNRKRHQHIFSVQRRKYISHSQNFVKNKETHDFKDQSGGLS